MIIRKARKEDVSNILDLWRELSEYHRNFNDYMNITSDWRKKLEKVFNKDIESDSSIIYVAEKDGRCIGFIRSEIRNTNNIFVSNKSAFITDIYIEKKYRGIGVAEELVDKVSNWCNEKKVYNLRLNVNSENERAIGLYLKKGFKEVNRTLKKNINV